MPLESVYLRERRHFSGFSRISLADHLLVEGNDRRFKFRGTDELLIFTGLFDRPQIYRGNLFQFRFRGSRNINPIGKLHDRRVSAAGQSPDCCLREKTGSFAWESPFSPAALDNRNERLFLDFKSIFGFSAIKAFCPRLLSSVATGGGGRFAGISAI